MSEYVVINGKAEKIIKKEILGDVYLAYTENFKVYTNIEYICREITIKDKENEID